MIDRVHLRAGLLVGLFIATLASSIALTKASGDASPFDQATIPPTNTRRPTYTPTPSLTPLPTSTPAPTATPIPAKLCTDCNRVRLRATPGTMGDVVKFLDSSSTDLLIIARSDDSKWVKVRATSADGTAEGWVSISLVRLANGQPPDSESLSGLSVEGAAIDASPSPTFKAGAVGAGGVPPFVSGLSGRAREIFQKGKSLGNRPNVFSKVGDSITASAYFLTPIGNGQYELGQYGSLGGVIGYFSSENAREGNSFNNRSLAANGGWSAFNVLQAVNGPCGVETPLICEYKLTKPAVALIMFGTNDAGSGSPGPFSGWMHQIVQTSIDMGVVPVLSTIPPKRINADQSARVDTFNQVIRQVAQEYQVPLMDLFAVMDSAPNGGMGSDGMHPSIPPDGATCRFTAENLQYGFTIRNLATLQALDAVWRLVLY